MGIKHLVRIAGLIVAALLTAPRPAAAIGVCSFNSTVGVNFGTYDVFNAVPTDSTGSITYTCTSVGPGDTITIDLSTGGGSSYFPRRMRQGGEILSYNLFLDAARVSVWGDGTGGTSRYGPVVPPLALPVTVTIYGRIPAGLDVSRGSYTDTIRATINF